MTVEQRPHLCLVAELHCGINVGHCLVLRNDWLPNGLQLWHHRSQNCGDNWLWSNTVPVKLVHHVLILQP